MDLAARRHARAPGLDQGLVAWVSARKTGDLRLAEFQLPTWIRKRSIPRRRFVFAPEFVDPACGIDEFLFPRVKRVAVGADLNMKIMTDRGTGAKLVAATASHGDFAVFGMNARFHRGDDQHGAQKDCSIITQSGERMQSATGTDQAS